MQKNKKIIISGGGTGGHVFPAIAIADALRLQLIDPDILFVGARGRMEMEKVPESGYTIIGLPIEGFRRKLSLGNLKVIYKLLASLVKAGKLIRKFSPDVVVGVGGYASAPVLRKAARMGIPTLIQEQNSYAGVTNRLLAKKSHKICVAYEGMERYFPASKLVMAGNPVRKEIRELSARGNRTEARLEFGLNDDSSVLLILGGSLGARSINQAVLSGLELIFKSGIRVIWQCGKYYYEDAKKSLGDTGNKSIVLHDFIRKMDQAYLAADAIISRAGAITISELCHIGKPAILVPSPNVAEDHQTKNAQSLADKSAAICIRDQEAGEKLIPAALSLLKDPEQMRMLSINIAGLAIDDSASLIAAEVIGIMK
ncbi:undecaprenyldiphospho-muramoylpentapeptide beta-N-acetylglucosaminyltransferase [Bacteroidota bacterium]